MGRMNGMLDARPRRSVLSIRPCQPQCIKADGETLVPAWWVERGRGGRRDERGKAVWMEDEEDGGDAERCRALLMLRLRVASNAGMELRLSENRLEWEDGLKISTGRSIAMSGRTDTTSRKRRLKQGTHTKMAMTSEDRGAPEAFPQRWSGVRKGPREEVGYGHEVKILERLQNNVGASGRKSWWVVASTYVGVGFSDQKTACLGRPGRLHARVEKGRVYQRREDRSGGESGG